MTQYKLVPIEPTPKMINAAQDLKPVGRWHKQIKEVFKAMLEASPTTDTVTLSKADYDVIALNASRQIMKVLLDHNDKSNPTQLQAKIQVAIIDAINSAKGK